MSTIVRARPACLKEASFFISSPCLLDDVTLESAALALRQPAPNSETLIVFQRKLKAFIAHRAGLTNALGLTSRTTLFREECLWIGLRT